MTHARTGPLSLQEAALLWVLVALAVGARVIGLDSGLWIDEIVALLGSYREPLVSQFTVYVGDFQHTLYSVMARVAVMLFGESPWALRLPALIFGVATIPVTYLLGRELFGPRDGWLSAIFLTVFYPHVWFSQNARGYTMLAFFSTLATLMLLRDLRSESRSPSLKYALVLALGVYAHLTMIFLAVGHAVVCLTAAIGRWDRGRTLAFGLTFVMAAVLAILLYLPMLTQIVDFFLNESSGLGAVSTPVWALLEAIRVLQQGLGVGTIAGVIGAGVLFGLGVLSYAGRAPVALGLFLFPGVVTVVGATLARGTMYPRFFFFMVAFLVLILIRGTLVTGDWVGRKILGDRPLALRVAPAIVGVLVLGSIYGLVSFNYRYPKQDFEGAIAFVEAEAGPDDTIAGVSNEAFALTDLYARDYPAIRSVAELEGHRTRRGRLWLVFTFPVYIEARTPELMQAIDDGCVDREVFPGTIGGGDLIVCSFPPGSEDG